MTYRARFERLIDELNAQSAIRLREARIGAPTEPGEIARWQAVAGPAWPDGMSELYAAVSSMDVEYTVDGGSSGGVHIPPLADVWDYAALEDELWFDFLEEGHPFHSIRPIDRFVSEAYAVLYPVPPDAPAAGPAEVAYHYCGEALVPTGLGYREWLELLFRSRGVAYWLGLTLGPATSRTWVEEGIDRMAQLFPDFAPRSMCPAVARPELDV